MNEHDAMQVLLVRSFESQDSNVPALTDAEQRLATRAALENVGSQGAPEAFVAARAQAAVRTLAARIPALDPILRRDGRPGTWLLAAIALGLALGIAADVFGSGQKINLLAPPAWLVILWNLCVYALLYARALGANGDLLPHNDWLASTLRRAMDGRLRHALTGGTHAGALADFAAHWARARAPLANARVALLLHVASAAVALGLIAGMYLRGVVLEYSVGWSSTFLSTEAVHSVLSFLLAPALWLTGIQLPDVPQMESLRAAADPGREAASAAPWIHLYAVMLMLTVVLPRTLLAVWQRWRLQRLTHNFSLALQRSYFRRLLRLQHGEAPRLKVLPYSMLLSDAAQQSLRDALMLAFDDGTVIDFTRVPSWDPEDTPDPRALQLDHATHTVAVFDMATTPEPELHGAFLTTLRNMAGASLLVVIDEGGFARRFRDYPQRLSERRSAWSKFAQAHAVAPLFLDLHKPPSAAGVKALQALLDNPAEPRHA